MSEWSISSYMTAYFTPFVLASLTPLVWNLLLVLFLIAGSIIGVVLLKISKKQEDWKHEPELKETYHAGRLKNLAESIKQTPTYQQDENALKKLIEKIFFEKIQSILGFSIQEMIEMKKKDQQRLRKIIHDEQLADWVLNVKRKTFSKEKSGLFHRQIKKNEQYLMELTGILEKMEAWGG
jgi:hypothetical protein